MDLDSKRFCIEAFCDQLTSVTKDTLEYRCDAKEHETFCESKLIRSTGGPFISNEYFTYDRSSHHFSRTSSGSIGDIKSRPFDTDFSGTCTLAPFTRPKAASPTRHGLDALDALVRDALRAQAARERRAAGLAPPPPGSH